ncbi:MAG: hypothetical protein AVDCRST_MAG20-461 [uncultured Acidimicrobiales bacterium]|uniref:Uncharacterized protein n=1 Tax=uncultured Acidimicrobiales bacterium TaxID=310071 RepID=A0A6J4HA54_9ACTN|nr:MAG: hypothetical protein AVDCRST_MAG20-461 [uncultured Acidimicrobiales bacterium]
MADSADSLVALHGGVVLGTDMWPQYQDGLIRL